jgi:hypothetical protein
MAINSLRENIIRLTGKRERHEIMCRLALESILRQEGVNVALHPGGWAASASLLLTIARIVTELPITKVLELGCGQTTIMLAELSRVRKFALNTIEHDAKWAEFVAERSGHHIELATLANYGYGQDMSYGYVLNDLPGPFDLIIVDGPPGSGDKHSRCGCMGLIERHMANPSVAVVDDTHRRGERRTAQNIADWRDLSVVKEVRSTSWHTVIASQRWASMVRSLV